MKIEKALQQVNNIIAAAVEHRGAPFSALYKDSSLEGGKRLRASLFFSFSGNDDKSSLSIAAALELLHAATLIHDDILDGSSLRRGKIPLYAACGVPVSLLYGDYILSQSFLMIAALKEPDIYREVSAALSEVLKGEIDEHYMRKNISITKAKYISIISKKSGALFGLSCKLGAMVSGAGSNIVKRSSDFGVLIGLAYQILDDCSDYLQIDRTKQRFSDIKEGVITLPLVYLLKKCSSKEKAFVRDTAAGLWFNLKNANEVVFLMKKYGIINMCISDARSYLDKAGDILPKMFQSKINKTFNIMAWVEAKAGYVGA